MMVVTVAITSKTIDEQSQREASERLPLTAASTRWLVSPLPWWTVGNDNRELGVGTAWGVGDAHSDRVGPGSDWRRTSASDVRERPTLRSLRPSPRPRYERGIRPGRIQRGRHSHLTVAVDTRTDHGIRPAFEDRTAFLHVNGLDGLSAPRVAHHDHAEVVRTRWVAPVVPEGVRPDAVRHRIEDRARRVPQLRGIALDESSVARTCTRRLQSGSTMDPHESPSGLSGRRPLDSREETSCCRSIRRAHTFRANVDGLPAAACVRRKRTECGLPPSARHDVHGHGLRRGTTACDGHGDAIRFAVAAVPRTRMLVSRPPAMDPVAGGRISTLHMRAIPRERTSSASSNFCQGDRSCGTTRVGQPAPQRRVNVSGRSHPIPHRPFMDDGAAGARGRRRGGWSSASPSPSRRATSPHAPEASRRGGRGGARWARPDDGASRRRRTGGTPGRQWARACTAAGFPAALHDLRRSAVRNLVGAGVDQSRP